MLSSQSDYAPYKDLKQSHIIITHTIRPHYTARPFNNINLVASE